MSAIEGPQQKPIRNAVRMPARQRNRAPEDAWYRLLMLPVLIAIATGIGPYAVGAPLSRSIGIGLTLGLVAWLVLRSMTVPQVEWPVPPLESPEWGRTPRRWEVPGLDAALERPQHMSRRVLVRLADLATELLARRSVTIPSRAADQLLGSRTVSLLTDPEAKAPSRSELSDIIVRLTALATDPAGTPLHIPESLIGRPRRRRFPALQSLTQRSPREDQR